MKIADISIRRPVFALMMMVALIVFGVVAYPRIGVDLFPDVEFPIVTVTVTYPGADPASMESKVADPIEEAVNTLGGIKTLRSVNLESVTQVFIEFELDVDGDQAAQDIRDRVSSITRQLPQGIDPPVIDKFDIGASPILSIALSGALAPRELTKLADDVVKERIQRIPGVGSVELVGGRDREIQVRVDPARMAGLGVTIDDVVRMLQAQNIEIPAGSVDAYPRELSVKTRGEVRNLDDIRNIIIRGAGGAIVRVRDVAEVIDGAEDARSWSSMNGESALALVVRKQSGANSVEVADEIHAELAALAETVQARGARLSVPTDTTPYIEHSINDVQFDLLFGGILAVIIILFFLHDFRATFISALALPISVVATFGFINIMGFTFNNMTMLGLSLSIGILIDDAIVVIENIHRHLEMGKTPLQAAGDGAREIGLAVMATTFSLVAVFVPVAIMEGIVGRFFFQFGMTVSFAVLVSLFVSFTLTPMMSSRLLRAPDHDRRPNPVVRVIEALLGWFDRAYRSLLGAALNNRAITLVIAVAALVGSVVLVTRVPAECIPPEDRAQLAVNVELPAGTALEATQRYVEQMAADIRATGPGVRDTFVTVGGGAQAQVNQGQIQVLLTPAKERPFRQQAVMAWLRERYAAAPDAIITVSEISAIGGGGFRSQPIQFNIRGTDMDELTSAATALVTELKKVDGLVDVDMSYRGGKPELSVDIDRERAADLGLPVSAIATAIRAYIAGDKVSDFKDGLDLYDITVQLPETAKSGIAGLENLKVRSLTGQLVDLSNVVRVSRTEGPSVIERQARQRQVTVFANLDGIPLGTATQKVTASAAQVVPEGLDTDFAGMAEVMVDSFKAMVLALILAIVLVYMILAAQFNSTLHPFTIMMSLPFSVIGAFGGLYLTGMTLNIFSMIGVIMLMGLVTKNAILLVDYANVLRERDGLSVREALLEAGPVRLRPILMTTFAMIFGMLPVALALSEGGETRAPMAVTVIGGLITSTLLTLVVVPIAYSLLEGLKHAVWGDRSTLPTAHLPPP